MYMLHLGVQMKSRKCSQNPAFLSLCELVIVASRWGTATAPGDPAAERVGAVGGSTFKVALKDMDLCCSMDLL